jgi:hypothetical protein
MMDNRAILRAIGYEILLWLSSKVWFVQLLPGVTYYLKQWQEDAINWRIECAMQSIEEQSEALVQQWEKQDKEQHANALAAQIQAELPDATVTPLPDAIVPSVLIEHPVDTSASEEVQALGGPMKITWRPKSLQ